MNEPFRHGAQSERFRIGAWTFIPGENELIDDERRHRLEHRAARTLELLCRRRGQVVSHEAILGSVWGGRIVSPNSLAIVVSDLREALGDDARSPRYIETIAKRGYRLIAGPAQESRAVAWPVARRVTAGLAALALLVALVTAVIVFRGPPPATILLVSEVVNDTGRDEFDPLAKSSSTVILASAQRLSGATVVTSPAPGAAWPGPVLALTTRLILWSGKPTLMLSALDAKSGAILWSGMTSGEEDRIPADVAREMGKLAFLIANRNEARSPDD